MNDGIAAAAQGGAPKMLAFEATRARGRDFDVSASALADAELGWAHRGEVVILVKDGVSGDELRAVLERVIRRLAEEGAQEIYQRAAASDSDSVPLDGEDGETI